MECRNQDKDVPELACGHPLPCPHHTVRINIDKTVPTIEVPITQAKRINIRTLKQLKQIARIIKTSN